MQHYISDSIYGLTLAWITSENSTKQLECRHLLTRSSSLDPIFSATVSGVDRICPSPSPTLSAPFSNQLSSRVPLPLPATPRFQVQKPFVWFRAKTDKGIVCLAGHLYSVTRHFLKKKKHLKSVQRLKRHVSYLHSVISMSFATHLTLYLEKFFLTGLISCEKQC